MTWITEILIGCLPDVHSGKRMFGDEIGWKRGSVMNEKECINWGYEFLLAPEVTDGCLFETAMLDLHHFIVWF